MKPRAKKYEQYANIFCIRTCFSEVIKVYYTPQTSHVQPFLRDLINILQKEQLSTENKKKLPSIIVLETYKLWTNELRFWFQICK